MEKARLVPFLLAAAMILGLRADASRAGGAALSVRGGSGAFYTASTRFNGKNHYIQVSKLSEISFDIVWNVSHDPGVDQRAHALSLDKDGNLVLVGSRRDGSHWEPLVAKFDSRGKMLWDQLIESPHDSVPAAAEVTDQGTIFVGATAYDGKSYSARIYKLWNLGVLDWSRDYNAGGATYLTGLRAREDRVWISVESFLGRAEEPKRAVVAYDAQGRRI